MESTDLYEDEMDKDGPWIEHHRRIKQGKDSPNRKTGEPGTPTRNISSRNTGRGSFGRNGRGLMHEPERGRRSTRQPIYKQQLQKEDIKTFTEYTRLVASRRSKFTKTNKTDTKVEGEENNKTNADKDGPPQNTRRKKHTRTNENE